MGFSIEPKDERPKAQEGYLSGQVYDAIEWMTQATGRNIMMKNYAKRWKRN